MNVGYATAHHETSFSINDFFRDDKLRIMFSVPYICRRTKWPPIHDCLMYFFIKCPVKNVKASFHWYWPAVQVGLGSGHRTYDHPSPWSSSSARLYFTSVVCAASVSSARSICWRLTQFFECYLFNWPIEGISVVTFGVFHTDFCLQNNGEYFWYSELWTMLTYCFPARLTF